MLYTRKYIDTIDIIHLLIFINIEVTIGIVYTPTGVCGETSTLNNGG